MKEGGGALQATARTHHVGKDKDCAAGEVLCNSNPMDETVSVGNGSRDLEDSGKEERTSADERLDTLSGHQDDRGDRQLCTNAGASVGEDPGLESQPKLSLPQPEEAKATEEPSSEFKNIPEESSDRTTVEKSQCAERTSSDVESGEAKGSVCGDFESEEEQGIKLGKELVDQRDVLSDIGPGKVEKPLLESEEDKCTSAKEGNEQLDSICEDSVEKCAFSEEPLSSVETILKSIEDQVFGTPILEECKESLDRIEKEQSLDESQVLEGPKRTEEGEACRIEECASASEAEPKEKEDGCAKGVVRDAIQTEVSDVKSSEERLSAITKDLSGAAVLSEGSVLDEYLLCDNTLGSILSVEKTDEDTQAKSDADQEETNCALVVNEEAEPKDSAPMTDENEGANVTEDVPERRVPVEDDKISAEEQAAKDIELVDKDISKESDLELDTEGVLATEDQRESVTESEVLPEDTSDEKDLFQDDKEDFLGDEGLSLESVSETSFTLNDNTEDGKVENEIDMDEVSVKGSFAEDTEDCTAEKGTGSVDYKNDFMAELEDISSEDNEDFFAEMEAMGSESNKDSVAEIEAVSLDSLSTREAVPTKANDDSLAEKEPFSSTEETSAEKEVTSVDESEKSSEKGEVLSERNQISISEKEEVSLDENKDSVSEKATVPLGVNEDIMAGMETVSSNENEDSLAGIETLSMETNEDYSAESNFTAATLLEGFGDSLSVNEAISLGSNEDFLTEKEQASLKDKTSGLAEMENAPVEEQIESRPEKRDFVEKEASQAEEAGSEECRALLSTAEEELLEEEEQIESRPENRDFVEKEASQADEAGSEECRALLSTAEEELSEEEEQIESRPENRDFVEKEASQADEAGTEECRALLSTAEEELSEEEEPMKVVNENFQFDEPEMPALSQILPTNTETTLQCERRPIEVPENVEDCTLPLRSLLSNVITALPELGVADSDRELAIATANKESDALDQSSSQFSPDAKDNISVQAGEQPAESAPMIASKDNTEGIESSNDALISDTSSLAVDRPDVEVHNEKQRASLALFSELEESAEPLLSELEESSAPLSSELGEKSASLLTETEESSTSLPLEVEQGSGPSPSNVDTCSTPQPSEVEETSVPQPTQVEESSVPLPSEVEEISAPIPSEVDENSAPIPSEEDESSAPIPSEVDESSTPIPSEVDESSAPIPSEVDESSAPIPSEVDESSAPIPSEVDESLPPIPSDVDESSTRSLSEMEESSTRSLSEMEESLAPSRTEMEECSTQLPPEMEESSAPLPPEVEEGSAPLPPEVEEGSSPLPPEVEECSSPLPPEVEEGSSPLPPEVEEGSSPLPPEVEEGSSPLPSEVEEGSSPLPPEVEEGSSPLPPEVEEGSSPLPPEVEEGSAPLPPEVEEGSAPLPPEVEKGSAPLPPEVEGGSAPLPPEVEEGSAPLPPEVDEGLAPLPPEVEEGLAPLPSEVEEGSAPLPSEVEEGSAPLPSEVEEGSAPLPSEVEEGSAPLPSEVEEGSPPLPSEVEEGSPPLPSEVEEGSLPLPSEVEEGSPPLPSEVEEGSPPLPSEVEEGSPPLPSEVEERSAPLPSEVEERSAPVPSKVEESSAPLPPAVEDSSELLPEMEESSALSPSVMEESSALSPSVMEESLPLSPSVMEESLPLSPSVMEESLPLSPSVMEESSALSPSVMEESSAPLHSEVEESSAQSTSKVEEGSAVPAQNVEFFLAASPPNADETCAVSLANVEESSVPSPPNREERSVPSPSKVGESFLVPSPNVEESSVPSPPVMEENSATLPEVEENLTPSPSEVEEDMASLPLEVNESTAQLAAEEKDSSAPLLSKVEETSVPLLSDADTQFRPSSEDVPTAEVPLPTGVLTSSAGKREDCFHKPEDETSAPELLGTERTCVLESNALTEKAVAEVDTTVSDKEIAHGTDKVHVEPEVVPVARPREGKLKAKPVKKERSSVKEELDIPLESLKQEELDIPSEPLDEDDQDDEPLDDNDSSYFKMEESAERETDDESALVIDEGDVSPPEMDEHPALLKTEALKRSLGSEVSIKLVPAKSVSEPKRKPKKVQSVSIIPKENLLNMSNDLQRRLKAQSLVKTAFAPAKVPTKVSKLSPKAPIPDLTPLQADSAKSDSAKTTAKPVGRSAKSAAQLKKSETIKSLLKAPCTAGPLGNWSQKGKGAPRGSDDFRPFPSLPKDTVVIPTYYVSEQDKAQQSPSQPMNLSTSNDLPIISKSIPASQPLPANVVASQRGKVLPLTTAPPRPSTKNVLPPSAAALPLPIQSMMPKMDNNMFPAMWSLFGPQLLSSQFLAAAAGASGTLPPFPMDPQKQNLLGAMLAASSPMPHLPVPPGINVYNTALMQMQAQMDALMQPKLPDLQNAPLPPEMNRYNAAALIQMQAQMDAFMPMQPSAPPMSLVRAPSVPTPVPPPVPPFAKATSTPQVKPQATILPQPKVPPKPGVQLGNQSAVDGPTAQPAVPRKQGGRNMKFTPGSSPRLVKRPTSAAATAVAAGLKIPVPAANAASRLQAVPLAKSSSPVMTPAVTTTPATVAPTTSKKFKVGSKLNSVVDKLLAGAGKQGGAVDLSCTAPPMKSSSPVPPRKDTPPLKDAAPVKKVIQVTNALTIELENRHDSRERRVRPPMPALLPCKPAEHSTPCEVILVDDAKRSAISVSRGGPLNGCVSEVVSDRAATPPHVVLTPEQARKTVQEKKTSALTVELFSREVPSTDDDPMSVPCSLPLDKVSVMLDKKSPAPSCSGLPTLPPTLAAGGLEILPMEIANSATSTPKPGAPDALIGANSISLGSNVSLTLTPTCQDGRTELEKELPVEELSRVEPCSPGEEDPAMEPTPSPPQLEPISSPLKRPAGVHDGDMLSPDKEVPSLDLEVPEGLDSSRATQSEDASPPDESSVASSKALATRKKFSFTVNSSFTMTLSDGQKLFTCDICSGVYQRAFSLKRHYLRSHINYIHLQERDISNCGIIVGNKMAVQTEPNTKVCLKDSKITVVSTDEESQEATNVVGKDELNLPGLYRCYTCGVCFDLKDQLRTHLVEHRPSGKSDSQEEDGPVLKENVYTCEVCAYPFRHKKNFLRHVEVCLKRKQPTDQSEWLCLFCNKTFSSAAVRSRHLSCMHRRLRPGLKKSRRSKVRKHTCMYCGTSGPKFNDLNSLLKHMCTSHGDVYFGCLLCEDRYPSKIALQEHTDATHKDDSAVDVEAPDSPEVPEVPEAPAVPAVLIPEPEQEVTPAEPTKEKPKKSDAFQFVCTVCKKMFVNEMNMNRHKQLAHGGPRGKKKRRAGAAARPPTPPAVPDNSRRKEAENKMDPEALFYSRLSTQIRENLMHHLDGKLDSQEVFEREEEEPLVVKHVTIPVPPLNPAASTQQGEITLDPHKVKNIPRRRSSESYLRLTWDKFNINKDKDSRNSVSSFIRDMSHIDIPTQLIMRRNMKRLSEKDGTKCRSRPSEDVDRLEYPSCIALTRSVEGSRSLENAAPESLVNSMLSVTTRVDSEEPSTSTAPLAKVPLIPAEDFLNGPWKNRDLSNEEVELSGEWVRPKYYLCAACDSAFLDNLYEMEDHQYLMHPNVWGTYWEFEESTLVPFRAAGIASPSSLYQRSLKPTGSLISAPPHPASQSKDIPCTKCSRVNHTVPELHRHMLDCGGDTTWHLTMVLSSPVNGRRNRKWRPFGSRRRRQQGRRGLKRNIPNTPQRPKTSQPKTRGGDAETIQRMIANLPAKRSTRRVIQFKEDEVKTRSQATIASTRLLRKRFKVPFPVSQSPLHKASRALLGRSMASSSSKPGHMPKARPLRSSSSAGATIGATIAVTARKASKVQSPPKVQTEPQEVAHTLVQVQTLIPAKVKKLAKSGEKASKLVKAKSLPNTPMAAIPSTSNISMEDIPEDLLDSPGKGEKNTDVILEAMRQAMMSANFHLCSVCGRMFNNSANRDRHFRVCAAQAEEGMPRLRKEAPPPRSRQSSKMSDIPVLSPSTAVTLTPGDSSKVAKSSEEAAEPSTAEPSAELLSSEPSGSGTASGTASGKKKKRTIVGIRKSLVQSEESGGGMVVLESFLVRVDSSSNELSETETKDKAEDELSDDVFDKGVSVEKLSPKKKDSKRKGAKRSKVELTAEKKKKKTKLLNEEEVPVKKLTRSKQASPQKVPVMRVDRSLNPDIIVSGVEVAVPRTVEGNAEDLPVYADPDNLDFEELLNTMDAEEIKQLDMIVPETPSSDADDDIPLGEQIPIWKKEAEAQGDLPEELLHQKPKKGMKRRSADIVLPAAKKTRSSSMLAEELMEAIEIEVEEPKKSRATKSPVAAKGKQKSLQDAPTLMLPPIAIPQESPKTSAKSRRRSSVMKVDPPAEIGDVIDEFRPEVIPVKVGKKKTKAAAKPAENISDVSDLSQEPEQILPPGKKKSKAAKQAESATESEPEVGGELPQVLKTKSKGAKLAEVVIQTESDVVREVKPTTKRKAKNAAKVAEEIAQLEFAVSEEVAPLVKKKSKAGKEVVPLEFAVSAEVAPLVKKKSKAGKEVVPLEFAVSEEVAPVVKKKSKAGKSAENIQPEADLVEVKPPTKRKSKASKPAEYIEEYVADLVEEIKPVPKRKSKGGAKPAENVTQPKSQVVLEEQVAPVSISVEPSDAAAASIPVTAPVSKKKSKAGAKAAESVSEPDSVMTPEVAPASKRKSKAKPAEPTTNPESAAHAEDFKPATKKKSKAVHKATDVVIEPDPNLVGELTPRNRKRIQPLEGDIKKTKAKSSDKAENPSSPAVATPDASATPPLTAKKGKATEETASTPKEATPLKEPEKKESQPVKRKQKKRASIQPTEDAGETTEVLSEGLIPKVSRKRPRSSLEGESKPAPKRRGKKKAQSELDASLDSSAVEESVPGEANEKLKAPKKKTPVVKTEPEEAPMVECAVTPGSAELQSKPKKKSKSKTNVEPLQVDDELLRKESEQSSDVARVIENEQLKSSECAAVPTPSTPMDPPAANSPTPGEQPDVTPKKRKSSIGSQFFCDLCQRHYSTAYNLTKHLSSLSHRALLRGIQTSEIVAASGDGEGKTKSDVAPKAEQSDKTAEGDTAVGNQVESNEEPFLDIGKDPLKNPTLQTSDVVGSHTSMEDSVVLETTNSEIRVQTEEKLVRNDELDVPQQTPIEQETPKSSEESVGIAEVQLQERIAEEQLPELVAEEQLPELVAEEQLPELVAEEQLPELVAEEQLPELVAEEQLPELVAEEQLPERAVEEQLPERAVEEQLPERAVEEQLPERIAEEQLPERIAEEQLPERIAEEQLPERIAEEQLPERIAEEQLPERMAEEQLPERMAEEQLPERMAEEQLPERIAEEQLPERIAEEQLPERKAEEQLPKRKAEEQLPKRKAEEQLPKQIAEEQLPERIAEEQLPQRITEEQTPERLAEEQTPERIVEEQLQEPITERQSSSTAVLQQIGETVQEYTPLKSMGEINPISEEALPVPTPAQASLVQDQNLYQHDYAPIPQNLVQDIHQQGYSQEQSYSDQQYSCYENRSWQGGDSGWGPWRIPDSTDEMSSHVGFGLGSILDSVNQVLAGDGGVASDLPDSVYAGYALNEIQNAVGATDEEMAVLRQLGEGSFEELVGAPGSVMWPPAEETQLLDLDNQRPNQPPESEKAPAETVSIPPASRKSSKSPAPSTSASGVPTPSKTPTSSDAISGTSSRDDTRSPVSMMPRPKTVAAGGNSLNELYEDRQMWCPSCHRRFLGLQAMKAHMAQHHSQNQRVERKATLSAQGSSEHRIICEVCREMVVDQVALELHMEDLHSGHNDPSKAVPASPSPGAKSRVLRMQMSHALGGLLDRALKNYLSKSSTGAASSVDTDRSRFTLGLLNKLALRHQAANQRDSPRSTPNPSENDGDGASSHSGSTTPTNMAPKRCNSRSEPLFVQYQGHPCPYCPEKFMSDAFVKRHVNNVHANLLTTEPPDDNISDSDSRAASPMEFCADPVVGDDGAFLCSSCGITFKSPSEVLEHQRIQHPQPTPEELARNAAENDEYVKPDTPSIRVNDNADLKPDDDLDSAEIAEKVSEFQQRVTNPLKGRALLTKDLKNKKIALAVESALLEHTAEVQVIAEAALRELGPCRKSSKSSTKESPKWGIDAVKFTVAKEPALIGAYGPVSEQESRQRNIPIVRKTPSSAPRFSFAERKKLTKTSTEVKPVKEKMEIYEFDESPRVEPLTLELKREVEDKSNKGETGERRSYFSGATTEVQEVRPSRPVEEPVKVDPAQAQESPKKALAKKRQPAKRKDPPVKVEGNPSKVAKLEKKKIFKKRKSDQGESSKSSEGAKSRVPRAEKGDADSSGRVRKQRRASTHDATDYSVFDFSSDESSAGVAVDVNVEVSATNSPRARRESASPPKKGTPSRVQELVEEDWTWLDDSESEKEKRKKMARRKRTKKKSDSPKKPSTSRDNTIHGDALEEETTKTLEEGSNAAGASKRRKRSEASAVAGSSGESAAAR